MNWDKQCMRLCSTVVLFAVVLRLAAAGAFAPALELAQSPGAISFFLYLQTGRVVRLSPEPELLPIELTEPLPTEPARTSLRFRPEEADSMVITDPCGLEPELAGLLTEPLDWDLTEGEPAVLILHTHTTESYTQAPDAEYEESSPYRTLDEGHNMLCLGALIARRLEEAGIRCIQDRELHDYPDYTGAYNRAAASTEEILAQYPSIQLVLDLHRDAAETSFGQLVTQCAIGSETAAQVMMVVGTDASGLEHPDWERNLSLALKLQALLERQNPGICRNLNLNRNRYNQHLGHRALLIEIGAAGNTLDEAALAAEALARAIIELRYGSE
ncbi:MAG: stage II sporulation protein P [Oscillospiraceae bacterium]|nr:stage II sporulation protein P [Oscillospiraceae bacterium]